LKTYITFLTFFYLNIKKMRLKIHIFFGQPSQTQTQFFFLDIQNYYMNIPHMSQYFYMIYF